VLPGLRHFVDELSVPSYVHQIELATAAMQIGVAPQALSPLRDGDVLRAGDWVELKVILTPGHSPGGMTLVAAVGTEHRLGGWWRYSGACNGIAACSTCHVILSPEQVQLFPPPTEAEQDMLDLAADLTPTSRLGRRCPPAVSRALQPSRRS
jgi:hypothetical protein